MNNGEWAGKQIVPSSWVHDCLQPCKQASFYGYLWWLYDSPNRFGTKGFCNTDIYCFPEVQLEIVRMQLGPDESSSYFPAAFELFKKLVVPEKR